MKKEIEGRRKQEERVEEVNKDRDEVIITMIEGWRGEINIACEEKRALIRPGSGDVIVNYHPLTHLHHTHTHTHNRFSMCTCMYTLLEL